MGMAASQARYLALVARKTNCEYEGQQINQARTALANQSANLFNQMLGLSVPIPPSTQDFTKTQYSYTDGINESTIDSWQQLANDPEYNYVVTTHYYSDVYTGSQKKMNDPQVQFNNQIPVINEASDYTLNIKEIQDALVALNNAEADLELKETTHATLAAQAARLNTYANNTMYNEITTATRDMKTDTYTVTNDDDTVTFRKYNPTNDTAIKTALEQLTNNGVKDIDTASVYVDESGNFAFQSDLDALLGVDARTYVPMYTTEKVTDITESLQEATEERNNARILKDQALALYNDLNVPSYVGNCELTNLATLTKDQQAEIDQIIKDMKEQNINSSLGKCFTKDELGNDVYTGGIYSFQLNGVTYYTSYYDLVDSANTGYGINNIDNQDKMAYYNATYVSTKIEETHKALVETDEQGRFSSIKFDDDSIKYTLNMETITDDVAYQDAMNQYYYENAIYDKTVQDINAKTSIIQREDQQLELRLKQLDTEQSALSTEIDAVSKVVKDSIEKGFKTFGG